MQTISSPLEAHKNHTIVFDMLGLDVGFDNPIFACLEVDYEEIDQDPTGEALQETPQTLTFYELDLGANKHLTVRARGGEGGGRERERERERESKKARKQMGNKKTT